MNLVEGMAIKFIVKFGKFLTWVFSLIMVLGKLKL